MSKKEKPKMKIKVNKVRTAEDEAIEDLVKTFDEVYDDEMKLIMKNMKQI